MMKEMIDIKNSQKWKVLQGIWINSQKGIESLPQTLIY